MSFYRTCMRNASAILFVIAVMVMLGTTTLVVFQDSVLFETGSNQFDNVKPLRWRSIFSGLVAGVSSAVWPFIGSALLYRLDAKKPEIAE